MLLVSDTRYARELVSVLQTLHHPVTVLSIEPGEIASLERQLDRFDIVILDLSRDRPEDWDTLDLVHQFKVMHAPQTMILCFSVVYRGASTKRRAERKGARFVYAE